MRAIHDPVAATTAKLEMIRSFDNKSSTFK